MKTYILKIASSVLFSFLVQSCSYDLAPYEIPTSRQMQNIYYAPSTANTPALQNKNDARFSLNYALGENHDGLDLQGAFAPIDHLGIIANLSTTSKQREIQFNKMMFGVGYITPISPFYLFEVYTGFESGKVINDHATGSSRFKLSQQFIQPAITVHNEQNNILFSFVSKFTTAKYKLLDTTFNNDREQFSASQIRMLVNKPNHFFWEPGLIIKYGWQSFVFNFNFTQSTHFGKTNFLRDSYKFGAGGTLQLNTVRKK